jgi:hypothetical protein
MGYSVRRGALFSSLTGGRISGQLRENRVVSNADGRDHTAKPKWWLREDGDVSVRVGRYDKRGAGPRAMLDPAIVSGRADLGST